MKKLLFPLAIFLGSVATSSAQLTLEEMSSPTPNYTYDFGTPTDRVSRMPGFEGGMAGFNRFLAENIKFPKEAREKQLTPQATVTFLVEKDGAAGHFEVAEKLGLGLDEELLRVLQLLPKFDPALNPKGEPMAVFLQIPLTLQPPPVAKTAPAKPAKKAAPKTKSAPKTAKKQ